MGGDEAFDFPGRMHANVPQHTRSGSAPVKAAARGETGLGIVFQHDAVSQAVSGFPIGVVAPCEGTGYEIGSMSPIEGGQNPEAARSFHDRVPTAAAQNTMPEAGSCQIPSNASAIPPGEAPDMSAIEPIDYDFAEYGSAERRRALLARRDEDIGSLPLD
jgi:iron(III) transport system substrate-binding protein